MVNDGNVRCFRSTISFSFQTLRLRAAVRNRTEMIMIRISTVKIEPEMSYCLTFISSELSASESNRGKSKSNCGKQG